MIIDCDSCVGPGPDRPECADCVVSFLTTPVREHSKSAELDARERRALAVLAAAGMIPLQRPEQQAG